MDKKFGQNQRGRQGVRWCRASDEMDTESAAMATNGEATKQKNLEARQNGYTLMLQAGMTEQQWRGSVELVMQR
jgi:hypothetical protein